jgi:hypothetical protein
VAAEAAAQLTVAFRSGKRPQRSDEAATDAASVSAADAEAEAGTDDTADLADAPRAEEHDDEEEDV